LSFPSSIAHFSASLHSFLSSSLLSHLLCSILSSLAAQGWLNYQVEHHMFPNLSMLSYQRAQPRVKALCAKFGIPYTQHSVWWRVKKTLDIMVWEGERQITRSTSAWAHSLPPSGG
jgi:hypothetical protein